MLKNSNYEQSLDQEFLLTPIFISCAYSLMDEIEKKEHLIKKIHDKQKKSYLLKLINQAKLSLQTKDGIEDIIKKYITKRPGKYLIVCEDICKSQEKLLDCFGNFCEIESFVFDESITSEKKGQLNNKIKLFFSTDISEKQLQAIDFDGIIIFGYQNKVQQLDQIPIENKIIIDVINDVEDYENICEIREEMLKKLGYVGYNDKKIPPKLKEQIKIHNDIKDIIGILKQIDFMYQPILSFEEMINLIKEFIEEKGISYSEIKARDIYKSRKIGSWIKTKRLDYKKGKLSKDQEKILRNLGETFEEKRRYLSFEEMINLIKEFMKQTGKKYDEINSTDVYNKVNISIWIRNRRQDYKYGKLNQEQIRLLRELGETFEEKRKDLSFEEMINLIKEFMKQTGKKYDEINSTNVYNKINISTWIRNRRQDYKYGKLNQEQIRLLRELGETFEEKRKDLSFEEMISLIKEYLKITGEKYSDIMQKTTYKKIKIGVWISGKRSDYKQGKLSKDQENVLRELGETFEEKRKIFSFEEMINLIKEYMNETGVSYLDIMQKDVYNDIKIGVWKNNRRQDYKNGRLNKEYEQMLRSMGEVFPNVHRIPEGPISLVKDANLVMSSKKR